MAPPPSPPGRVERGRLPLISWSAASSVRGLLGGLFLALLAPALVLPFDSELESDGGLLAAQALFGACLIAVAVGVAARWRFEDLGGSLRRLGLRPFRPSALGWVLAAMAAYYVAVAVFAAFVIEPDQEDIAGELGVGDESVLVAIAAVFLIAVMAPLGEELFFRGMVFSGFRQRLSFWPAALVAGLVFGSVHAPSGLSTVVPLAALGFVFCWLYERTGSLWPAVIAHALNNGLALALLA